MKQIFVNGKIATANNVTEMVMNESNLNEFDAGMYILECISDDNIDVFEEEHGSTGITDEEYIQEFMNFTDNDLTITVDKTCFSFDIVLGMNYLD